MRIYILLLILIGFIPLLDLFQPGLPITHDGQDHVARIANFYQNLSEGNIVPRWAANLNWGFGHPILMFLYPLPSYLASFFHFLGFNLVDSIKIIFGTTFLASGIFMFAWLKNFMPVWAGFTGGILYMFAPYRFVDLYVRGAIGEHIAFMFLPLILYFLFRISREKTSLAIAGGAISFAGLILSHNAISLMFMPIVLIYALYLIYLAKNRKSLVKCTIYMIFLGLGASAFFWIPAFFEGKYTLRDIVTSEDYRTRFVQLKDLIFGTWSYGISGQFTVQLGILHWIFSFLSIPLTFILYKKKSKLWILSLGVVITLLISVFLMLESSVFIWDKVSTLQKFQFPWRFLSITVFATSVLGALVISQVSNKYKTLVLTLIIFLVLFLNKDYWKAKDFLLRPESFYTGIYNSTTDTGESSPIWSVRFMEKRAASPIEVISGEASVQPLQRKSTKHVYNVDAENIVRLRENTLYFPGWKALVDGKQVDIEFQDRNSRGLITFLVSPGKHTAEIIFEETKLRLFSNLFLFKFPYY